MNIVGLLHIGDVFIILLLWAATFAVQKVAYRLLRLLPYRQTKSEVFYNRFNIILWSFFVLLSLLYLGNKSLVFTIFLVVSAALAFWSFWRDFFAYIVLQFNNEIKVGEKIKWQTMSGTVKRISTRNIYIETDAGKMEIIPLHLFVANTYTKVQQINRPYKFSFKVSAEKTSDEIKRKLFANPWVIKHLPVVVEKNEDGFTVTCFTFDKDASLMISI